jgi:hypothetical protein
MLPATTTEDVWLNQTIRNSSLSISPSQFCATMNSGTADMPTATIVLDANLKDRLEDLAGQTGQKVDDFVESLLRRIAEADVRFDGGVPVFRPRPGAPLLTVQNVDSLEKSNEA